MAWTLLLEALSSILREARRIVPMAAGIVWGVASVFVLVAIGRGFESSQRGSLEALGESFVLLRVNRPTLSRGDVRADSFVRLDGEDVEAMRAATPSVAALSPKATNWFVRAFSGRIVTRAVATGVDPAYADIVHIDLEAGGRWIDEQDLEQELPVCVIGWGVRNELFGDGPYLGQQLSLIFSRDAGDDTVFRRLEVVGALSDVELSGDDIYTSHRRQVFLPFTTWERFSPRDFQFFVLRPKEPEQKAAALQEVRDVLGARHGFDPQNENTLVPYFDSYERRAKIDAVFGGLETFLSAVGALILALGAVGVANVVLMSVTARTFEFGLRRALGCRRRWIFVQVFLEAGLVCLLSGLLGFGLGVLGIEVVSRIDLPSGFAAPRAELSSAWLPGVLLLVVSLAAAAWPATRAARTPVARALSGGKL